MKKTRIVLVFIVLLAISCKQNNNEIKIEYYENGKIKKVIHDFKNSANLEITFSKEEDLESVGNINKNDMPIGYFCFYTKGNLYHQRQYLIINGKSYVNQFWNIDPEGNIDKNMSNFFSISSSGDTVLLNNNWTINVFLDCPVFGKRMEVYFGDYDESYNLRDSTSLRIIKGHNNQVSRTYTFSTTGKKIIRGIICDWDKDSIDSFYNVRVRKQYFTKWVVVVSKL